MVEPALANLASLDLPLTAGPTMHPSRPSPLTVPVSSPAATPAPARAASSSPGPRRTEGRRSQGRSARVVCEVLRTVVEELGRVGYGALRVEDVAATSGVNKTTIYRRWPTKQELVTAALRDAKDIRELPDTGTLRGDLLAMVQYSVDFACSPSGRGIVRTLHAEAANPEVAAIVRTLRHEHWRSRSELICRGVKRGELPASTNPEILVEIIHNTVYSRLLAQEPLPEEFIEFLVDFMLTGAHAHFAKVVRDEHPFCESAAAPSS
jgi:AcrR family transcriptional regulator